MAERISVEVCFAEPGRQSLVTVQLDAGATVAQAIAASGVATRHPDHDVEELPAGIWGRLVERSQVLNAGDRVEIYRELGIDPREARRQLAMTGKTMRDGEEGGPA